MWKLKISALRSRTGRKKRPDIMIKARELASEWNVKTGEYIMNNANHAKLNKMWDKPMPRTAPKQCPNCGVR